MTRLETSDGLTLESAWSRPHGDAYGVAVVCHPHPLQGGTMNAPLVRALAGRLADAGFHVLRFNFRGVGRSEGGWGGGEGEVLDVGAAVEAARAAHPNTPFALAGWSFGAVVALRWQAHSGDTSPYAGIAPAVVESLSMELPPAPALAPARRLLILGDRDRFCAVDDLAVYAEAIGARLEVLAGSDHFFVFRDMEVGRLVADHFRDGSTGAGPGRAAP
jgi:uncharacterized protein